VTAVANVGEQRPNTDAKVFEVKIAVEKPDTTLRPGMTTGNAIETMAIAEALSIPLEAVISEGDVPYVFLREGRAVVRQEVRTGAMNDDEVVILAGLEEGSRVLLSPPVDRSGIETKRLPGSGDVPKSVEGDSAARSRQVPVKPDTARPAAPAPPAGKAAPPAPRTLTPAPARG
jgi:hypothetical protein